MKNFVLIASHRTVEPGGAFLMLTEHARGLARLGRLCAIVIVSSSDKDSIIRGLREELGPFLNDVELCIIKPRATVFGAGIVSLIDPSVTFSLSRFLKKCRHASIHLHKIDFALIPILLGCVGHQDISHTAHDFGILCPSTLAVRKTDGIACQFRAGKHCVKYCGLNWFTALAYQLRVDVKRNLFRQLGIKIVSPSHALAKYIRKHFDFEVQVAVCSNPISGLGFREGGVGISKMRAYQKRRLVIVYAGSLTANKGVLRLPAIFESIENIAIVLGFVVEFFVFGAGDASGELAERFRRVGLADRVNMPGFISFVELQRFLVEEATIVVVPSECQENQSGMIREAARSGCIVLASKRGGNPENVSADFSAFLDEDWAAFLSGVLNSEQSFEGAISGALDFARQFYDGVGLVQRLDELFMTN